MKAVALMATRFRERSEGVERAYGNRWFKQLEMVAASEGFAGIAKFWKKGDGIKTKELVERFDLLNAAFEGADLVKQIKEVFKR